jgi:hypothetical protein
MDNRIDFFKIFENENKLTKILCYPAYEVIDDPYEKDKVINFLNPLTIKAVVMPLSFESLRWKYYGQLPLGSKQVLLRKKDRNIVLTAFKIQIGEEFYKCYKDDRQGFAIKEYENYVIVILERKII